MPTKRVKCWDLQIGFWPCAVFDASMACSGILALEKGPLHTTMAEAMAETEEVIFEVTEELLKKTGIKASEVRTIALLTLLLQEPPPLCSNAGQNNQRHLRQQSYHRA